MKHFIFSIYCAFLAIGLQAQTGFDFLFSEDGYDQIDFTINYEMVTEITTYPDGKILAAGYAFMDDTCRTILIRYLENGTLDLSFGEGGISIFNLGYPYLEPSKVKIDAVGNIYVSGCAQKDLIYYGFIARFFDDGSIDNTFADDGLFLLQLTTFYNKISDFIIRSDYNIIATFYGYDFVNGAACVIKLDASGNLIDTFGEEGIALLENSNFEVMCIGEQSDGKLVGSGTITEVTNNQVGVFRLTENGEMDLTFSDDGWLILDYSADADASASIFCLPENKTLIATTAELPHPKGILTMLEENGNTDVTFGEEGIATIDSFIIADTEVDLHGNYLVIDGSVVWEKNDIKIAKILSSGFSDPAFGEFGIKRIPFYEPAVSACLAIQTDGKIVTGGYTGTYATKSIVSRILSENKNGLNNTFAEGSVKIYPNPIWRGAEIFISTPKEAQRLIYTIIDLRNNIIKNDVLKTPIDLDFIKLTLPVSITAGVYYLTLQGENFYKCLPIIIQ